MLLASITQTSQEYGLHDFMASLMRSNCQKKPLTHGSILKDEGGRGGGGGEREHESVAQQNSCQRPS